MSGRRKLDRSALWGVGVDRIEMLEIGWILRRPDQGKRMALFLIGESWLSRNERQDKGESNPFLKLT